jgi:hypothetical protein
MQEAEDEEPALAIASIPASPVPPPTPAAVEADDYGLHFEETPLMDSDEAMEILSLGGEIPEVLRNRLQKTKRSDRKKS